ncbi:MAG: hypothetical protein L6Q99_04420 [Planctomycetes bacterium]|nr:hypothetical protein [Planctomycetota bacterium]
MHTTPGMHVPVNDPEQPEQRDRRGVAAPTQDGSSQRAAPVDARSNGAPHATANGTPTEPSRANDERLERLLYGGAQVFRHLRVLAHVRADRGRLALRRTLQRAQRELLVSLASATAVIAGVALLATGLSHGLTSAFGERAWAGELGAATVLLGGTIGALALRRARAERAELETQRRKYASLDRNPFQGDEAPTTSHVGGTARPSGTASSPRPEARPAARRE